MAQPEAPVRADVALVDRGVVRSRALAQRLIDAGAVDVVVDGRPRPLTRRSQLIPAGQALQVRASPEGRFASRGGAKLDDVLTRTGVDCRDMHALDVGMSTGGFTDCLLHHDVFAVVGIEVGHGQLDGRLASDPRVTCFEKTHIRDVTPAWFSEHGIDADAFALVVVDLSFISTIGLLAHLAALVVPGTALLALIKPQFELGPDARNSRGIVRASADIAALRARATEAAQQAGWTALDWIACALPGTDGNQEYFLHATRRTPTTTTTVTTPAPSAPGAPPDSLSFT